MCCRRAEQRTVEGGAFEVHVDAALPRVADAAVQLHCLTGDLDGRTGDVRLGHRRGGGRFRTTVGDGGTDEAEGDVGKGNPVSR